ncbi:uncharacterized protein LOC106060169 [Biomphalaria glabrata]|uniref:Uncharacterized protein LOC106060169 n=1 Tax=Biomphalaria glabrata TaxID=6526 RepID=A0A9W3BDH1_BIOGL|nr:uncharacterized protein LOC106060169 [Biomphalaria glabrata]
MMVILGAVIALLLGHSLAQVHVLPMIDPLAPLTCYHCDEHMHSFPECLSTPVTCHADEVCSIAYSTEKTNIKCQKASECALLTSHAARPCAEGGFLLNTDQCQTCCNTSTCVGDLISKNISVQNDDIFCPSQCSSLDLAACVHSQIHCTHGQYCEVTVDDHHTVHGACKAAHELQRCNEDKNKHPCSSTFLNGGHGTRCVWDCCTTLDCLKAHFGAFLAIPTTLNIAVTSTAPVQVTSVRCLSCIGSECLTSSHIEQCTGGLCRHIVNHLSTGQIFQEKGCATREECHLFWTSEDMIIKQECMLALDPNLSVHVPLNCHYCCSGDFCNVANITSSNVFNL